MLKISLISPEEEGTNGRKFISVSFRGLTNMGNGKFIYNNLQCTRNVWEAFTDNQGRKFNADLLYTLIKEGSIKVDDCYDGEIVKVNTTPFQINGKEVRSFTGVIFQNEDVFKTLNRSLRKNKACALDDDGNKTAPGNLVNNTVEVGEE